LIEFLDSSALVKRYVSETGSALVRRLCTRGEIAVARIVYGEVAATLARACREGLFDEEARDGLLDQLAEDVDGFETVEIRRRVMDCTRGLVIRHPLRGYDAVQLACAIAIHERGQALRFWSADVRLVGAARGEGIRAAAPK
jgi:predicted nucleic acid-binding protein